MVNNIIHHVSYLFTEQSETMTIEVFQSNCRSSMGLKITSYADRHVIDMNWPVIVPILSIFLI